jgi:uncharacterized protein (DUF433 family)
MTNIRKVRLGGFMMIPTDRIELNPRVCDGKPVIKGTRIPVSVILEQIATGESWDALLTGYPEISKILISWKFFFKHLLSRCVRE